jgi:hypothetical protein
MRENKVAQDNDRVRRSLGTKISSREQGPDFDLVRTSWNVDVRDLRGHTYDVLSDSSPAWCIPIQITTTLSDMSGRLLVVVIL